MRKQMSRKLQLLLIGLAVLAMLSCNISGGDEMPTITPVPPTQAPPEATPLPEQEEETEPAPETGDRQVRRNLIRSTVQIVALMEGSRGLQPIWTGSGSIISPDGLILTNAHVVSDPEHQPDALGVAITVRSDELPEAKYLAEIRAIDPQLDLAVIQITSDLDGRPIDMEQLNLDYVQAGDSDLLELGDLLRILGYPTIGGETITFTEGSVSGFTRERGVEGRAWIKTDATIAGGNSGGLAANAKGQIIGIPTQVGYGGGKRFADCRYLADTNGDGVIDENDNCIPVGGFINALRPVNLADPLIEAARTGIALKPTPVPSKLPSGEPRFFDLLFAPDVTDKDQPTRIVSQLPSGVTDIYAFWEYENMSSGLTWEARWYYEDQFIEGASQPPQTWRGEDQGSWWASIYNTAGLDDGVYRIELYVEEEILVEGSISVGGADTGPTLTDLIFSEGVTADDRPTNPTYLLPSGITDVYAFFDFESMSDGLAWRHVWSYEGEPLASNSETWSGGESGFAWVSLSAEAPLDPGAYRLELFVEGNLVAASDFTIAGTQAQEAFGPITFAAGADAQGNPVNPGTSFPAGLKEIFFFTDYSGMQDGLSFEEKWLYNGEELITFDLTWQSGASGTFYDSIYRTGGDAFPDGEYTLELYVGGQLVQQASAVIGTGTPPPTPTPMPEGLHIEGYILDADTGRGIPGAFYVVLKPGVTADAWDGNEADIYTAAEADANGYFELPLPLERGQSYSIIVWAEGYQPAVGDGLMVGNESSPLEVEIALQSE
jgi:serine protease Do